MPQSAIVSATRSIICLTERSRSGVPRWPRKYLLATTLVARALQLLGELEVLLLEHGLAVLVGDRRFSEVPVHRVIRMDVRAGVSALDAEALPGRLLALPSAGRSPSPSSRVRSRGRCRSCRGRLPCRWRTWWERMIGPWWGRPSACAVAVEAHATPCLGAALQPVRRLAVRRILRPLTVIRPQSPVKAKTTTSGGVVAWRTTR